MGKGILIVLHTKGWKQNSITIRMTALYIMNCWSQKCQVCSILGILRISKRYVKRYIWWEIYIFFSMSFFFSIFVRNYNFRENTCTWLVLLQSPLFFTELKYTYLSDSFLHIIFCLFIITILCIYFYQQQKSVVLTDNEIQFIKS